MFTPNTVASQVSKYMANAVTISSMWGGLLYNVKTYGAKGDGITNDAAKIADAITAASTNGGTVVFPPSTGTYIVNSNLTFPSNVTVEFSNGAKLSINTGITVTINGPINAGLYQIFSGLGTVAGSIKVPYLYPQWWGAKGDGVTDDTTAIQADINAAIVAGVKAVFFPKGNYIATTLTNLTQVVLLGDNATLTVGGVAVYVHQLGSTPLSNLNRQALINGNFDIWQRGTSFVISSSLYTADRWWASKIGNVNLDSTVVQSTDVPNSDSKYSLKNTSTTVSATPRITQKIEDTINLSGKTVTISCYIKLIGTASAAIIYINGVGASISPTTAWTKVSITRSNLLSSVNEIGVQCNANASGDGFLISQFQVTLGDVALPFQPRSFAEELQLCQRYYEKSYNQSDIPGTSTALGNVEYQTRTAVAASTAGSLYTGSVTFKVRKRINPTIKLYSSNGTENAVRKNIATVRTGATAVVPSEKGFARINLDNTSATAIALDDIIDFQWTADAEL